MADIDKKELEHLADLARITLDPAKEGKLIQDFHKILEHFNELGEVKVLPNIGLRAKRTVIREDVLPEKQEASPEVMRKAFPESEDGYLAIPPIFE